MPNINQKIRQSISLLILAVLFVCMSDVPSAVSQQAASKAQDHASKGLQFAQKGDLKSAEAELRRAVAAAPRNPLYWSDLGSILRTQKKLEEAISCYQKALKIDSRNFVIRRNLALTQWDLGRLPEARRNLESVLSARPDDKLATLMLGMVTESLKDYAAARKLLESVLDLVRERPESVASLARAYYHTGEKKKARETLESMAAVQPVEPEKIFAYAQVALEADDYETAERLLLSIRSTYADATRLGYSLAVIQFRAGRVDESEKALLELIRTERSNSQIYNLLGHCFQKQGKVEQAVGAFEKAVEQDPAHESNYLDLLRLLATNNLWRPTLELAKNAVEKVPVSHSLYEVKGLSETILLLTADAIRSYTRALELNPASAKANLGLAVAQSAAGMNKEAAATFERGIQQFPRDALHYQEYGLMLLKQGAAGDSAAEVRGISLLETALSLENRLSEAQYHLGSLALTRGETQRALPYLETAVKLEPNVSKIRFALARAYRRLDRADEASKELEVYHRLKAVEEKSNPGFPAVGAQFK